MSRLWSKEEIKMLKNNYQTSQNNKINKLLPNRSNTAIKLMARKLNLNKLIHNRTKSNIEILLNDSLISFYWIGFILADGNISKKALEISLNIRDERQIAKLAIYLNTNYKIRNKIGGYTGKSTKQARIKCCNKYYLEKIRKKFDINSQKTYNPPNTNIWNFTDDQILSILTGFIDGDGSVIKSRNNIIIKIKLHKSWIIILNYFHNFLSTKYDISLPIPFFNKNGFAEWRFSKVKILNIIKKFIIGNNLPVLERKWDKINENRTPFEKSINLKRNVLELFNTGLTIREISERLFISTGYCYRIIKKKGK